MPRGNRTHSVDLHDNPNLVERPSFWSWRSADQVTAEAFVFEYMKKEYDADVVRSPDYSHHDGVVTRSRKRFLYPGRFVEVKLIWGDRIKFFYDPIRRLMGPEGAPQLTWLKREDAIVFFLKRGRSRVRGEMGAPWRQRQWFYTIYIIKARDIS